MNSNHFIAVIEKEAGALYGGWFPDCPGAASAGNTMDECTRSASASLRTWVADSLAAGKQLPAPRSLEEMNADPDVTAARSRGAVLLEVPLI
ncbi:type II toxin-antitoxin system HicB family antitoxin [Bosea sp. BIWAKO-01]|uniref:type II toxin-antitoxin system HicB family antitoxin n=1 Tax=Bosea sp. BIWAKO-01 TaxID=506668 RepID=UPI0009447829